MSPVVAVALLGLVAGGAGVAVLLGLSWFAGTVPREKAVTRLSAVVHLLMAVALVVVGRAVWTAPDGRVELILGSWFAVGHYEFPLRLMIDRVSFPLVALTVVLSGVIGHFSSTYLHREAGLLRFFFMLEVFTTGAVLAFSAGSFDLLVAGWELVGVTSVLLVSFFYERPEPVDGAVQVFAVYRATDVGLLSAVVLLHLATGHASVPLSADGLGQGTALLVASLLLLSAMGKSAQVPFSGWLPRAMEGPTPSSAIFYGAISVHLGAYLLLRLQPLLDTLPGLRLVIVIVGLLTAVHGTLAGRVAADAKTQLAHAALSQLGLIVAEAGAGWTTLATVHIVGHACVRTLQFLRAPSMLHDHHQMHAAVGGHLAETGAHLSRWVPPAMQQWLFRLAMDRGHLDTLLTRVVVEPLTVLSRGLGRLDHVTSSSGRGVEDV
jgi:NADH-quinone oxidoreductase subunit L